MLEDWEPSYFRAVKGEPSLTDPEEVKAYWRKWREQRGEPS
jgi:hypothetical protein